MKDKVFQVGIIDTRKCPHCGHHEVGCVTRTGDFQALKPGTWIQLLENPEDLSSFPTMGSVLDGADDQDTDLEPSNLTVWLPEALRSHRNLRLKYAVLINKSLLSDPVISAELYQIAYMAKLRQLVFNTIHIPLPVILDRFFASPHLASGNPRQVTEGLWRELEEIRKPVILMQAWLLKQDEENLAKLIQPLAIPVLTDRGVSDEQLKKELDELSIEFFFELL